MLNKIKVLLIFGIFLVSPTVAGIFLPITFNRKLSSGGLLIALGLMMVFAKTVRYEKAHKLLLVYIGIQAFFVFVSYFLYGFDNYDFFNENVLKPFITSLVAISAVWFVYKGVILNNLSLQYSMFLLSLGVLATACTMLGYAYMFSVSNVYVFRNDLYHAIYDARLVFTDIDISMLSLRDKLFYGSFVTLGGTAIIGPLLSVCGATFMSFALFLGKGKTQGYYLLVGLIASAAIFTTGSRSAILSMLAFLIVIPLVIVFAIGKINPFIDYRTVKKIYGLILLAILVMLAFRDVASSVIVSSFSRMSIEEMANTARLSLWAGALKLAIQNPLGYGYEYVRLIQALGSGLFPGGVRLTHNHLHNTYLTNLNEFGIIGFVVFLTLLKSIVGAGIKNIRFYYGTDDFALAVALLTGMICSMINMMFGSMFLGAEVVYGGTFWIIVTMILIMAHRRRSTGRVQ